MHSVRISSKLGTYSDFEVGPHGSVAIPATTLGKFDGLSWTLFPAKQLPHAHFQCMQCIQALPFMRCDTTPCHNRPC